MFLSLSLELSNVRYARKGRTKKRGQGVRKRGGRGKKRNARSGKVEEQKTPETSKKAFSSNSHTFISGALAALQHSGVRAARVHLFFCLFRFLEKRERERSFFRLCSARERNRRFSSFFSIFFLLPSPSPACSASRRRPRGAASTPVGSAWTRPLPRAPSGPHPSGPGRPSC